MLVVLKFIRSDGNFKEELVHFSDVFDFADFCRGCGVTFTSLKGIDKGFTPFMIPCVDGVVEVSLF